MSLVVVDSYHSACGLVPYPPWHMLKSAVLFRVSVDRNLLVHIDIVCGARSEHPTQVSSTRCLHVESTDCISDLQNVSGRELLLIRNDSWLDLVCDFGSRTHLHIKLI